MKPRILTPLSILVAIAALTLGLTPPKLTPAAKQLMREKLLLSQGILEGISTADFDLLVSKASRLSGISRESGWPTFDNPDYQQQSALFRRQVDQLVKAAKDQNLDAATLAYVRMTMSCVDCHKVVRGKTAASLSTGSRAVALSGPSSETAPPPWMPATGNVGDYFAASRNGTPQHP